MVLLLDTDAVVDEHLHVEPIVLFLLQLSAFLRVLAGFYLLFKFLFDPFGEGPRLANLLESLAVVAHVAEDGCLIEVGGHDVVLVVVGVRVE